MKSLILSGHEIVARGLLLLLLSSQGCSSTPPGEAPETKPDTSVARESPPIEIEYTFESNRRVFEGCDPAEEVGQYEDLVGEKVLITWAWKDATQVSADLKVPALVLRIDSPYVVVDFDSRIPNRDLYISVWAYSGHVEAQSDGAFGVDPCSATFERGAW